MALRVPKGFRRDFYCCFGCSGERRRLQKAEAGKVKELTLLVAYFYYYFDSDVWQAGQWLASEKAERKETPITACFFCQKQTDRHAAKTERIVEAEKTG